jgi:hypothetical protein
LQWPRQVLCFRSLANEHGDSVLGEVSMDTRMLCRARGDHS